MSNLLALPNGTELVGDYRIKRVLGAGGFGITYLAEEPSLARLVTIKEYFPADFAARNNGNNAAPRSQNCQEDYKWGLDRFIEEAQTLAKFDHPNIVRVYRYFRLHQTGYMVLHFEEGASFKAWLNNLGRAPRQHELDAILAPLLDALELIHKADFLHRDIAPDNIIVRKDGNPVLIDFGSARGAIAQHSQTISALVKPGYSPYEQYAMTSRNQGPWTDIYSLAATMYFAIAGKRPSDAPSRIIDDELIAAREVALSSYRPSFLTAIDKALRLTVNERPQSITTWRQELLENAALGSTTAAMGAAEAAHSPRRASYQDESNTSPTEATKLLNPAIAEQQVEWPQTPHRAGTENPFGAVAEGRTKPVPPGQSAARRGLIEMLGGMKKKSAKPTAGPASPAPPGAKASAVAAAVAAAELAPDDAGQPAKAKPANRRAARKAGAARRPGAAREQKPERRQPPRPQRIRKKSPWGLRSLMLKLLIGVGVAGAAVAMQDKLPRMETRGFGMNSSLNTDVALTNRIIGHRGGAYSVAFSSDGKRLVSTGADATIKLWSAVTGGLIRTIELDNGPANAFAIDRGRAVTGHKDGTVVLWNLETGAKIASFKRNEASIWSVAFAGDPGRVVVAAHDWSVTLWDERKSHVPVNVFEGHGNAVQAVAFTDAGPYIASGGADEKVKLWNASDMTLKRTYRNLPDFVTAVAFSSTGKRLAVGSLDGVIKLFSTKSRRTRRTMRGHEKRITSLVYAPNNRHLASASIDGTIRLWDTRNGRKVKTFKSNAGPVNAISFSPRGDYLAAAEQDGSLHIWKTASYMTRRKTRKR